ncbi:MAG: cytochrome c biogenesis protein ResB [Deferrisomatales bacterium]|nr:cytochrome c biogenesis protein ResB [Deferrisomatales bacterium]
MRAPKPRDVIYGLASLRLTLALLLLLAVASAVGTVLPQGTDPVVWQQRYGTDAPWWGSLGLGGYYRGWWFRGLWAALIVNLLACGVRRSVQGVRDFLCRGRNNLRLPAEARAAVSGTLRGEGFRLTSELPLRARRRSWGFLGFPLVHLSPVLIVAGALWGSWGGFTGTAYGFLRAPAWTFFNWTAGVDQDLPFVLVVEEIRRLYHPLRLRAGVGERGAGGRLVETREGGTFPAAPYPYRVEVDRLDVEGKDLRFYLIGAAGRLGPFSSAANDAPLRVVPVEYKDPELRQVEAGVTVRSQDNQVLRQHTLAVNRPLVVGSLRIYLTAWSENLEEDPWVGLQIVKDPGQGVLWVGSVALAAGILMLLFVRGGWAREEGGEILIRADREVLRRVREAVADGISREASGTP